MILIVIVFVCKLTYDIDIGLNKTGEAMGNPEHKRKSSERRGPDRRDDERRTEPRRVNGDRRLVAVDVDPDNRANEDRRTLEQREAEMNRRDGSRRDKAERRT